MLVSVLEGHRRWAPHYDSMRNPLLALETRMVRALLEPIPFGCCCVDVACGTGRWMTRLGRGGASVFGVDACPEMLAEAQRKSFTRDRIVLGDAVRLPFASSIADTVLCSFAAGYLPDLKTAFSEMTRVAKPGAKVILSDLHPAGIASGWTRSFRLETEVYEMQHFARCEEQLRESAQHAGLGLHVQIDACFAEPERPHFQAMGKDDIYLQVAHKPAVWIAVWKKP